MPAPISWPPSEYWDGDDGSWSSFALRVGNPEQVVRVLPSTAGQATWVVTQQGCLPGEAGTSSSLTCDQSRGALYDASQSTSWKELGNYSLGLEVNLGYNETATYGLDTIALGFSNSTGGPSLESQVVAGIATDDYYLGIFGLGHEGTNLTNFTETHPSFLSELKAKDLIPSLSWGYTAGAPYRLKGVFGSLTFGGYDSSRFAPNNISFSFAPDISRDLVVGLQSISITTSTSWKSTSVSVLPTPILSFIDSTLPYIYLPLEACQAFERSLGLVWNDTTAMYWIDDALHQELLSNNSNFTFTIGDSQEGGATVEIVLPYSSFDIEANYPFALNATRYFPLQRAMNDTQYTLGRTFLQEAYIIADYERSKFSVSQCIFQEDTPERIVAIPSATTLTKRFNREAILGTSFGAATLLSIFILAAVFWMQYRRRKMPLLADGYTTEPSTPQAKLKVQPIYGTYEIDQNSLCGPYRELPDSGKAELLNAHSPSGSGKDISEMPQALPPILHELRTTRSSREKPMVQIGKKGGIFVSTKISRKSWTSIDSSDGTPRIETIIFSSPWHSCLTLDKSSVHSFNTEREILASYRRKSLDLDRSLPPTPISESPQVSPIVGVFNHRFATPRPLRISFQSKKKSMIAVLSPKTSTSGYSSLKGMETVVPPNQSGSDVSEISAISREEQKARGTWF